MAARKPTRPAVHKTQRARRQFLKAACAAGAGLAFSKTMAGPPERPSSWQMHLSTSSIHFMGLPIDRACEQIAKLGFEAVDIWSAHAGCPHLDDVLQRLGPEGLKQLLQRTGLKLSAFSVYRGGYPRYAELLGKVGGGVAVRGSTKPCPPQELTARMREFLESLKPELELAEKYDSYLAIENHGHRLLNSLDSFKAFVDLNRHARLGIALAPYHLQAIQASVPEAIEVCGRQLLFFYAWQRAPGTGQLPGHSPADFAPWIAALEKVRYDRYVNPFMHGEVAPEAMSAALAKARQYLLRCYQQCRATQPGSSGQ